MRKILFIICWALAGVGLYSCSLDEPSYGKTTSDNYYHLNLPQDSGFESTEGAYDLKEMHRIVTSLPKEYKVPFSMHVSGFKYREIAEKLNLPLGTVKSRIFFTRQKLQEELKDFR